MNDTLKNYNADYEPGAKDLLAAPPGSAGALTLSMIQAAMSNVPPKPKWCEAVMNTENYQRLHNDPIFEDVKVDGFGVMKIYCKPGQVAMAWMFQDHRTAVRYLEGELTELDLMELVKTGACQPNS